ncbi:hypothetical protein CDL12_02669 [Handroanthus impetiginosus]|uniref:Protein NUCLEAR FUSION DEFECTIVE 6, chloroplastic/mitochondrial-like n=1 Tax=Handroanthus impetiginosus TaxID=429701 RepID=A0A2G9I499_9LAMI|nr:hypothetical protein CDL12_02669 [Handroanthus impetiginosus]
MASACRSAAVISRRSLCSRFNAVPKSLAPNLTPASAFSSSTRSFPRAASRFASVLGSLETMLPLHSTVAAARLKSNLAMDTTCWSWLSQDFAIPR